MPTAVLIQIDGWDPVAGAAITLRMASDDDERLCWLNGVAWFPVLADLPELRLDLFDGAFTGAITTPSSAVRCSMEPWPNFARYALADARVRIWTGALGAAWAAFVLRFDGRVTSQPSLAAGMASIDFAVDDRWLDAPLLPLYAGTGGVEGGAELAGVAKPLALGAPRYVPGRIIDAVNNVVQISGCGVIEQVECALDRLVRLPVPSVDLPNFAALVAATIAPGQVATCLASGLVRHGAPVAGQASYLVRGDKAGADGWARLPGAIIRRIATLSGGAGKIHDASLNALDAARPFPMSIYIEEQTTARAVIQDIAASFNAVAGVDWLGRLFIMPVAATASIATLAADGSSLPPVGDIEQLPQAVPFWRLAITAVRTWSVHDVVATATPPTNSDPVAPTDLEVGQLYIRPSDNRQFRFVGRELLFGGAQVTFNGGDVLGSGYHDVQDFGVPAAQAAALAAQADADAAAAAAVAAQVDVDALSARVDAIDDDDVLSISEKVEVLIPAAAALEALWQTVSATATTAAVSTATASAARAAWLAYLAGISPAWNSIAAPSPITRGSLDAARNDYDAALKLLNRQAIEAMTAARTPDLTGNLAWAISGDAVGAVISPLPADRRFSAFLGTVDVSPTTDFALSSISPSLALTVNNTAASADRGVVTMGTGTTGSGTALLTATLPGGAVVQRVIAVTKTNAIPPAAGGSGSTFAQDTSFTSINSGSHAAISDELVVRSDASGNVRVAIDLAYQASGGTAARTPSFKAAYATSSGGSLTDLFAEGGGSSCIGGTEPEEGAYVRAEATIAMPAASTDYYFKLLGRRSSGTGIIAFIGNNFTVRQ